MTHENDPRKLPTKPMPLTRSTQFSTLKEVINFYYRMKCTVIYPKPVHGELTFFIE